MDIKNGRLWKIALLSFILSVNSAHSSGHVISAARFAPMESSPVNLANPSIPASTFLRIAYNRFAGLANGLSGSDSSSQAQSRALESAIRELNLVAAGDPEALRSLREYGFVKGEASQAVNRRIRAAAGIVMAVLYNPDLLDQDSVRKVMGEHSSQDIGILREAGGFLNAKEKTRQLDRGIPVPLQILYSQANFLKMSPSDMAAALGRFYSGNMRPDPEAGGPWWRLLQAHNESPVDASHASTRARAVSERDKSRDRQELTHRRFAAKGFLAAGSFKTTAIREEVTAMTGIELANDIAIIGALPTRDREDAYAAAGNVERFMMLHAELSDQEVKDRTGANHYLIRKLRERINEKEDGMDVDKGLQQLKEMLNGAGFPDRKQRKAAYWIAAGIQQYAMDFPFASDEEVMEQTGLAQTEDNRKILSAILRKISEEAAPPPLPVLKEPKKAKPQPKGARKTSAGQNHGGLATRSGNGSVGQPQMSNGHLRDNIERQNGVSRVVRIPDVVASLGNGNGGPAAAQPTTNGDAALVQPKIKNDLAGKIRRIQLAAEKKFEHLSEPVVASDYGNITQSPHWKDDTLDRRYSNYSSESLGKRSIESKDQFATAAVEMAERGLKEIREYGPDHMQTVLAVRSKTGPLMFADPQTGWRVSLVFSGEGGVEIFQFLRGVRGTDALETYAEEFLKAFAPEEPSRRDIPEALAGLRRRPLRRPAKTHDSHQPAVRKRGGVKPNLPENLVHSELKEHPAYKRIKERDVYMLSHHKRIDWASMTISDGKPGMAKLDSGEPIGILDYRSASRRIVQSAIEAMEKDGPRSTQDILVVQRTDGEWMAMDPGSRAGVTFRYRHDSIIIDAYLISSQGEVESFRSFLDQGGLNLVSGNGKGITAKNIHSEFESHPRYKLIGPEGVAVLVRRSKISVGWRSEITRYQWGLGYHWQRHHAAVEKVKGEAINTDKYKSYSTILVRRAIEAMEQYGPVDTGNILVVMRDDGKLMALDLNSREVVLFESDDQGVLLFDYFIRDSELSDWLSTAVSNFLNHKQALRK